ncbi:unnamed protein product [Symbiodinium natans]|uniref:Uncharacterized protein n=1 Tax=Symbiodinium natans TaxID=878477 RepID=A0A812T644_9DINO|nr:unnamed protein product [Symbiodinium natans]
METALPWHVCLGPSSVATEVRGCTKQDFQMSRRLNSSSTSTLALRKHKSIAQLVTLADGNEEDDKDDESEHEDDIGHALAIAQHERCPTATSCFSYDMMCEALQVRI